MITLSSLKDLNLTREGLMVNYGKVIQSNIKVDILLKDNTLKLSYYDINNIYNVDKTSLHKYTFLRKFGSEEIIGILPLDNDWYLCW
jgi:hypothetical protein